jgi:hypothetical protein
MQRQNATVDRISRRCPPLRGHAFCLTYEVAGYPRLPPVPNTLRIPYLKPNGTDGPVRFRIALEKGEHDDCFRWKKCSTTTLYGIWRLSLARKRGSVVLVEGESDCHTLWYHDVPAIGLPGAGTWNEAREADHLDGTPHHLRRDRTGRRR